MSKVPKLRFPEFSGEWKEKKLNNTCKITSGGTPSRDNVAYWNGNIPWITTSLVNSKTILCAEEYITEEGLNNSSTKIIPKNSILMAMYGQGKTRGQVAKLGIDATINQACLALTSSVNLTNDFLFQNLNGRYEEIRDLSNSGGQKNLSAELIKNLSISFPPLPEQEKIAGFLSSVDKGIELLEQKINLFEQYKKGIMQKIFSQELRFKDENGEDYPEWEEKQFGDIYSFKSTNSYSRDNLNYEDGEVKNIHYGDIHTKFKTLFNVEIENVPFINQDISLDKILVENYCQNGDLVIADASEDYADIGKSIEITNINNQKILAGLHTFLARPTQNKIALGFGGYLMKSYNLHSQIKVIAQGTKVLSLSSKRVAELKIPVPSLPEQIQIADFLASLDLKIEITSKELDGMREFKKGLLQQMFV